MAKHGTQRHVKFMWRVQKWAIEWYSSNNSSAVTRNHNNNIIIRVQFTTIYMSLAYSCRDAPEQDPSQMLWIIALTPPIFFHVQTVWPCSYFRYAEGAQTKLYISRSDISQVYKFVCPITYGHAYIWLESRLYKFVHLWNSDCVQICTFYSKLLNNVFKNLLSTSKLTKCFPFI